MLSIIIIAAVIAGYAYKKANYERKTSELKEDLAESRTTNRQIIDEWAEASRFTAGMKAVEDWYFLPNSDTQISVKFRGDMERMVGEVKFTTCGLKPRVSRFMYIDKGFPKIALGTPEKRIPLEVLVKAYNAEKADKDHLAYVNTVAEKAMEGETDFDLLTYQGMSEDEFVQTYGEHEINAFTRLLGETFSDVSYSGDGHFAVAGLKEAPVNAA